MPIPVSATTSTAHVPSGAHLNRDRPWLGVMDGILDEDGCQLLEPIAVAEDQRPSLCWTLSSTFADLVSCSKSSYICSTISHHIHNRVHMVHHIAILHLREREQTGKRVATSNAHDPARSRSAEFRQPRGAQDGEAPSLRRASRQEGFELITASAENCRWRSQASRMGVTARFAVKYPGEIIATRLSRYVTMLATIWRWRGTISLVTSRTAVALLAIGSGSFDRQGIAGAYGASVGRTTVDLEVESLNGIIASQQRIDIITVSRRWGAGSEARRRPF